MLRAFTQICVNMASRFFCFGGNFNPFCFLSVWGFTSQYPLQIVQNWGFGLVISAIFAKEIAKKVRGVDYRLLITAAYSGFVVWHAGLSGSIPLTLSSGGEALAKSTAGILSQSIPSSMTIFSGFNLAIIVMCFPFLLASIHPTKENALEIDKKILERENKDLEVINYSQNKSLAVWLENSFLGQCFHFYFGFCVYCVKGGDLNLILLIQFFYF
ncbi:TIGR00366 family protein [Campylobacter upsaliensis]|uniref:TIGR00366 family protein n=1 Tax=Campylobacter upsaliensis TaxID=28080 RepID=UPI0022EA500C|nr:TIGR00366 family protein [Campylobacter upsaliensis]MEB2800372.1 TIGR00366 family protein [Campylobacter upsaliensis]